MVWQVDTSASEAAVTMEWVRREDPASQEAVRTVWHGVRWIQKNGAHWLMYDEGDSGLQTVLILRPQQLTWIRRGSVDWRHQFEVGQEHASQMTLGGNALPVSTQTHSLDISVDQRGGHIELRYTMDLAGMDETVEMTVQFYKED